MEFAVWSSRFAVEWMAGHVGVVGIMLTGEDFYYSFGNLVVDLGAAKLVHNPRYPLVHDANHVRAVALPEATDPKEFVLDVEGALQDRGLRHSVFHLDRRTCPESFRLVLSDLGYDMRSHIGLLGEERPSGALNHSVSLVEACGGVWQRHFLHILDESKAHDPLREHILKLKEKKYAHPSIKTFVLFLGIEPAGIITLLLFNGLGLIKDLYVRPHFRGKGIARTAVCQLMSAYGRYASGGFGTFLRAGCRLIDGYKRLGFREITAISWFVLPEISAAS